MINMDLVVTVDTAAAHLAGALARPVWVLLPFWPDWRWMLGRSDSPWYPTMRLFRQEKRGDWDSVFERVRRELENSFVFILRLRDRTRSLRRLPIRFHRATNWFSPEGSIPRTAGGRLPPGAWQMRRL